MLHLARSRTLSRAMFYKLMVCPSCVHVVFKQDPHEQDASEKTFADDLRNPDVPMDCGTAWKSSLGPRYLAYQIYSISSRRFHSLCCLFLITRWNPPYANIRWVSVVAKKLSHPTVPSSASCGAHLRPAKTAPRLWSSTAWRIIQPSVG